MTPIMILAYHDSIHLFPEHHRKNIHCCLMNCIPLIIRYPWNFNQRYAKRLFQFCNRFKRKVILPFQ